MLDAQVIEKLAEMDHQVHELMILYAKLGDAEAIEFLIKISSIIGDLLHKPEIVPQDTK